MIAAVAPAAARAVSPAAEALFEEGKRLMAAGNTAEACQRFAESNALEPSSGKLLNLALCHEREQKTATAWAEYRAAARLARNEAREDRAATAVEKAAALEPKLARVTATAADPAPGLTIVIEQGSFDAGGLGVAVPIDPGTHQVRASAPGYRAWTGTLEIAEGEQKTFDIPALTEEPKPSPHVDAPVAVVASAPARASRPRFSSFEIYTGVGGAAVAIAATAVYAVAYAKFDAARAACNSGSGCTTAEHDSRVTTIQNWEYVAVGGWIAGGGLLLASGLHWLYARSTPVTITIAPSDRAVFVAGQF
jgi:hypothetical protein